MSGIATAIIGSAVVGGVVAHEGASQAAGAANSASRRATDATLQMYNQGREDQAPWREAGGRAVGQVSDLYSTDPVARSRAMAAFFTSPQYEFVRDQGVEQMTNSASARGGQISGNAARGEMTFRSGLASGEFGGYVDRLLGIAGLGAQVTGQGVQAGGEAGGNLANIYTNQGNARASAYLTGAAGVNNAIQGGLQNWAFNTYMNRAPSPASTSYGSPR